MTQSPSFADVNVGDAIPSLDKPAIDRVQLALYAGGSGDHNAIHLDDDRAKSGGLPGVIAHGMLSMAFLGQLVCNWVPQSQIREFGGRFASIVKPGDVVTCGGTIKAKDTIDGENRVEVEIHAETGDGTRAIVGKAVVVLP